MRRVTSNRMPCELVTSGNCDAYILGWAPLGKLIPCSLIPTSMPAPHHYQGCTIPIMAYNKTTMCVSTVCPLRLSAHDNPPHAHPSSTMPGEFVTSPQHSRYVNTLQPSLSPALEQLTHAGQSQPSLLTYVTLLLWSISQT